MPECRRLGGVQQHQRKMGYTLENSGDRGIRGPPPSRTQEQRGCRCRRAEAQEERCCQLSACRRGGHTEEQG